MNAGEAAQSLRDFMDSDGRGFFDFNDPISLYLCEICAPEDATRPGVKSFRSLSMTLREALATACAGVSRSLLQVLC